MLVGVVEGFGLALVDAVGDKAVFVEQVGVEEIPFPLPWGLAFFVDYLPRMIPVAFLAFDLAVPSFLD